MSSTIKIGVGQFNPRLGDFAKNLDQLLAAHRTASAAGCEVLVLSELFLCGYPPEDLILQQGFVAAMAEQGRAIQIAVDQGGAAILVGLAVNLDEPWPGGIRARDYCINPPLTGGIINAAALFIAHRPVQLVAKSNLPNYGVFDEKRIFAAGARPLPLDFGGHRLGVLICEDLWQDGAARYLADHGSEILICINGSPYELGKGRQRLALAQQRVTETGLDLLYVNQWGGQDELVFDGVSFFTTHQGESRILSPAFADSLVVLDWSHGRSEAIQSLIGDLESADDLADDLALDYRAIVVGLSDYLGKNGFSRLTLGLSGGVDSALVAAIAVDAVGADRVAVVMMPSPYTSAQSLRDAEQVAEMLGLELESIDILAMMQTMAAGLSPHLPTESRDFGLGVVGVAGENLQSRLRGMILMALSNGDGSLVLTTGNKSELATGYSTLYGDSCGAFAPLRDVYKMRVFALSHWRNQGFCPSFKGRAGPVMPRSVIDKPPSAELRPNQTDQDSLPDYRLLDAILYLMIEGRRSNEAICDLGYDSVLVARIRGLLDRAEYKRRQGAIGVKLTSCSFGRDRRMPMTGG
ncbi:MAG: NAD+ synthase [Candidatus Pacebacteria bacterium]|nr:NAD+ synthase [Candidatus Paceibacterota bacterium]